MILLEQIQGEVVQGVNPIVTPVLVNPLHNDYVPVNEYQMVEPMVFNPLPAGNMIAEEELFNPLPDRDLLSENPVAMTVKVPVTPFPHKKYAPATVNQTAASDVYLAA